MNGPAGSRSATVVTLRLPTQAIRETRRGIRAQFPGWSVWHVRVQDSWYAYRVGEDPYFGPPAASGRKHEVTASDSFGLVVLLEEQVRIDLRIEFPGWRVRRAPSGGWYAFTPRRTEANASESVRLVHAPVICGLLASLRTLTKEARRRRRP